MHLVLETPTLQHLAGVKIITELWNPRDILTRIEQSFNGNFRDALSEEAEEWKEMEKKVKSKVSVLPLPQLFKRNLFNLIKPIGVQIIEWLRYHNEDESYFQFLEDLLLNQLRWTMRGTVDYAKTAEVIAKDERVNEEIRFEIACINCLEEKAKELFTSMSEDRIRECYEARRMIYVDLQFHLIVYFTDTFNGNVDRLNNRFAAMAGGSINKRVFKLMIDIDNRAAVEYLFNKLNQHEKEEVSEECAIWYLRKSPTCHLLYYLSLMSESRRNTTIRDNIYNVLICLLHWPMQSLFTEAAQFGWQFMNDLLSSKVLDDIIYKINRGYNKDYDYAQLFWECWHLCSAERKKHFLSEANYYRGLFETKKEEFIKLVLNEAPSRTIEFVSDRMSGMFLDLSFISDAALLECKKSAALESSNDKEDEEKRLRSQLITQLVNSVMEKRSQRMFDEEF